MSEIIGQITRLLVLVFPYLLLVNLITYLLFAWDKYRAVSDGWRVRESTLLFLAFVGGSPLAKVAQHRMRHKTRKQPFGRALNAIVGLHLMLVLALLSPTVRTPALTTLEQVIPSWDTLASLGHHTSDAHRTLPKRFGPGS